MRVGLGTGSTAHFFIVAAGEAVRSGLRLQAVATSQASAHLAEELGIQLVELDRRGLDLAVDGADQIDPNPASSREAEELTFGSGWWPSPPGGSCGRRRRQDGGPAQGPVPVEILQFGSDATLRPWRRVAPPSACARTPEADPR